MPEVEHSELNDQEEQAFKRLYMLCFMAMGGDQLTDAKLEGLSESKKNKMRDNVKKTSYRIAVGVAAYIEAVSKKSTVSYKPTRTGDTISKQVLLPVFDKHYDETVEDRLRVADRGTGIPDWIEAE
jgi:hypothetical protein